MSYALGIGSTGPVSEETVDTFEAFYLDRGARPTISISKASTHDSLLGLFENRGYERGPTLRTYWRLFQRSSFAQYPRTSESFWLDRKTRKHGHA